MTFNWRAALPYLLVVFALTVMAIVDQVKNPGGAAWIVVFISAICCAGILGAWWVAKNQPGQSDKNSN